VPDYLCLERHRLIQIAREAVEEEAAVPGAPAVPARVSAEGVLHFSLQQVDDEARCDDLSLHEAVADVLSMRSASSLFGAQEVAGCMRSARIGIATATGAPDR
jgi:hypothetical protein